MVLQTGPLVRGLRKEHEKGMRAVAFFLAVILTGFFCLSAWAPEPDAEKGKAGDSSGISSVASEEYTPGVLEQEMAPPKAAKKRFPWFWVAAGALVVGVVLYFTVIKKPAPEYTLNVSLGPGVSGYPSAGTFVYKKGKKVPYVYSLGHSYRNLKATLDGKEIAASGEFTMDRDHVLAVTSEEQFYDLTVSAGAGVSGTPPTGVYSYKEGTSVAYSYAAVKRNDYLQVQVDGVDVAVQGTVLMDRAHTLTAVAKEFDVRGMWRITASSDYLFPTQKVIFAGSPATGKVYRPNGVFILGSYDVTGNDIRFFAFVEETGGSQSDSSEFTGTVRDMNNIGGTCSRYICDGCGYYDGTWEAVRIQ